MQNMNLEESSVPDSDELEVCEDVENAGTFLTYSTTLLAWSHLHLFI